MFFRIAFLILFPATFMLTSCRKEKLTVLQFHELYTLRGERLKDICFPTSTTGFASATNGLILKTTDGGQNWEKLMLDSMHRYDIQQVFFLSENKGVVQTLSGMQYFTGDGGQNWNSEDSLVIKPVLTKFTSLHPKADQFFINSSQGYQFNFTDLRQYGLIWKTQNGGKTWDKISTGQGNAIYDVDMLDIEEGFAVGDRTIMHTIDGGKTWEAMRNQDGTSPETYKRICITSGKTLYAITDNTIVKISL